MDRRSFSLWSSSIAIGLLLILLAGLLGPRSNALAAPAGAGATNTVTPTPTSRPGADFSGTPLSGTAPLTVQFTALNGSLLTYCSWTFGDGTSQIFAASTGTYFTICPSTTHTYTSAGSFNVTLYVVKGTNGFSNSMTKTGYIQVSGSGTLTSTPTASTTNSLLPDLVITSISYVGSSPACANKPQDAVVVSNIGNVAAGPFVVAFNTLTQSVSGLAAGAQVTLSFSAVSAATATADSTNIVAESNEGNNSLFAQLPVPTQAYTCTPTASITPTATPSAVVLARGHVHVGSASGPALANVKVCIYLAAYQFNCDTNATLTDQNGYYQLSMCVPQQETVTILPSLSGYTFAPANYTMINYGGCTSGTFDFVAQPGNTTTPTPTPTPTITPTRTLTPTVTPTGYAACSPLTGSITVPFSFDGAGTFCWQTTALGSYINSWNLTSLTINGVDFNNRYYPNTNYPPKINGYYYIRYVSAVAWGHFEAK